MHLLEERSVRNLVTQVGINDMLSAYFLTTGHSPVMYAGLIANTSFSSVNVADTAASHAGWIEAGGVDGPQYLGNRPQISMASIGAGQVQGSAAFTMSAAGSLRGIFLNSQPIKDSTAGLLFNATQFTSTPVAVNASNIVTVQYTLTLS